MSRESYTFIAALICGALAGCVGGPADDDPAWEAEAFTGDVSDPFSEGREPRGEIEAADLMPLDDTQGIPPAPDCADLLDLDGDGDGCNDWIEIPPGSYVIGSPPGEPYADTDEQIHVVKLTRPVYLARLELAGAGGLPVLATWPEAISLLEQINRRKGQPMAFVDIDGDGLADVAKGAGYRLPTEAEWEIAARAGRGYPEISGDGCEASSVAAEGWYCGNSGKELQPVGQLAPNPWGFHDMAGNAREWVSDWYGPYPGRALYKPLLNPRGPGRGIYKVLKGGAFDAYAGQLRAADRFGNIPDTGSGGIRIVFQP